MVQELKLFFTDYPRQILEMQGMSPAELPAGLMDQLLRVSDLLCIGDLVHAS